MSIPDSEGLIDGRSLDFSLCWTVQMRMEMTIQSVAANPQFEIDGQLQRALQVLATLINWDGDSSSSRDGQPRNEMQRALEDPTTWG
jgi:hypothetical protein